MKCTNKISILDILKEGVSLNKYSADFNNAYHKEILLALKNKDEQLKKIVLNYLTRYKYADVSNITAYEVRNIINSIDFNRENKKLKEEIIFAMQDLVKDDMPKLKENLIQYNQIIDSTKIGIMKSKIMHAIKETANAFSVIDKNRGAHYELFFKNDHNPSKKIQILNEAVTLFNNLEVELIQAGNISNFKTILNNYINKINKKDEDGITLWADIKMAINEYLQRINEKYSEDDPVNNVFVYYLINRPPSIGTQPNGTINIQAFDKKCFVKEINRDAWGYVTYDHKLTKPEIYDYELIELKSLDERKVEAKNHILHSGVAYNGIRTVRIIPYFYKKNRFNVEVTEEGNRYISNNESLSYEESIKYALEELFYEKHNNEKIEKIENEEKEQLSIFTDYNY